MVSKFLMYGNEILKTTCHCYLLLKDHRLFLAIFEPYINDGISGKTHRIAKSYIFVNTSYTN